MSRLAPQYLPAAMTALKVSSDDTSSGLVVWSWPWKPTIILCVSANGAIRFAMLTCVDVDIAFAPSHFAIMKALGASAALINSFFAAEAAALGTVGAVLGFALGLGIAAWIGRVNFHASVAPRLGVFPVILAGSVLVALLSAIVPISLLQRLQPANILRGE